jgi:hypothetical protein
VAGPGGADNCPSAGSCWNAACTRANTHVAGQGHDYGCHIWCTGVKRDRDAGRGSFLRRGRK